MFVFMVILMALVLVALGYFVLWCAVQPNMPAGVSRFGKVLAAVLFIIAGLVFIIGLVYRPCRQEVLNKMIGTPYMMQGDKVQVTGEEPKSAKPNLLQKEIMQEGIRK